MDQLQFSLSILDAISSRSSITWVITNSSPYSHLPWHSLLLSQPFGSCIRHKRLTNAEQSIKHCDVIKTVKKENITKENIGEIMLMQMPGVSSVLAKAILSKLSSFSEFIDKVNTEPGCLNGVTSTLPSSCLLWKLPLPR